MKFNENSHIKSNNICEVRKMLRYNNFVTRKLCTYSHTNSSITDMLRDTHMHATIFVYVRAAETDREAVRLVRQTQL